jgi:hypothetical protein
VLSHLNPVQTCALLGSVLSAQVLQVVCFFCWDFATKVFSACFRMCATCSWFTVGRLKNITSPYLRLKQRTCLTEICDIFWGYYSAGVSLLTADGKDTTAFVSGFIVSTFASRLRIKSVGWLGVMASDISCCYIVIFCVFFACQKERDY